MGQNFGNIVIKRTPTVGGKDVSLVQELLGDSFKKDKEVGSFMAFWEEKWGRPRDALMGFCHNEHLIELADEYDLVPDSLLQAISEKLQTEVLKATRSDTAGISMITLYDKGELRRKKSFGLEQDLDMLSGEELASVEGIGEPAVYEKNGSDATNVYQEFRKGKIGEAADLNVTIYLKRK